ncbi:MAG TPA: sodium:alanine symporter family protein [Gemmatimonadota bacterium]|nr:sodium:alanine symporter family protein [Gemmatimonadota bacterium]
METFERLVGGLTALVWDSGFTIQGEVLPYVVIALIGTGIYLTLYLGLIQVRQLGHGFAVTSGKYDDPAEPGDVSHFQALTTALSATVGIGNIAGVAIAIHLGGPGALFWMWMTAFLGMATKYTEVTLAQRYRSVTAPDRDASRWEGTVAGGPMYYIERGLGPKWKPMAIFFAIMLGITAFFTGNAIQANTVADSMEAAFGIPIWITGLVTATIVALVIIGGITRIGRVTAVLAPAMAAIYVAGALFIILVNIDALFPSLALVFREAFNPSAGVAGTGVGVFLVTMMWGVRRGLFSNEAGQGSAPIAHAAAKTDEPVSEGVVALLEPFIDTIVICTMTALVIITTGVWDDTVRTQITLRGGDISYLQQTEEGAFVGAGAPAEVRIDQGRQAVVLDTPLLAWHEVAVDQFYEDPEQERPFTGVIHPARGVAISDEGVEYTSLYGPAVESAAPLTALGFQHGLPGTWGNLIVLISVLLFAISTAISWSYYGDRCAYYLLGPRSVLPYKFAFVLMHFLGAVAPLAAIWALGDVFLGIVILPNLLALIILSPRVKEMTESYFARRPWVENYEVHRQVVAARKSAEKREKR